MLEALFCVGLIGLTGQTAEKPAIAQTIRADLDECWSELANRNETRAALAMLALATSPRETTAFLKERVKPVKIDANNIAKWLSDLDSDDFQTSSQAMDNLEYCGKYIRSDLEKTLKERVQDRKKQNIELLQGKLPPVLQLPPGTSFNATTASNGSLSWKLSCDDKGNLQVFLNDVAIDWFKALNAPPRPWMRAQRAVAILEHFGTPEARQILESLASGEADALPTTAARAALGRRKGNVDQEKLWAELANPEEANVISVMLALAAKPKETIALFKEGLKPVKINARLVAQLLSRLESDSYVARNQAMQDLESCGPLIRKNLNEAHKNATTLESKRRIEELLAKLPKVVTAAGDGGIGTSMCGVNVYARSTRDGWVLVTINGNPFDWENVLGPPQVLWMRAARAVTILQHFGNLDARSLLHLVATGEADAPPTIAARAALWRMSLPALQATPVVRPVLNMPVEPTAQQLQAAIQAFAKIGGQFSKEMDWTTRQPVYMGSLPRSATDEDLKKIPFVPFSFGVVLSTQEKITNAGMANLASVKNLCYLSLNGTSVTEAGLNDLANVESLVSLDLSMSKVADVEMLARIRNLSALNLHGTHLPASVLRKIPGLKALSFLDLSWNEVVDADLREIARCQGLSQLNLYRTLVTDDGIRDLTALRNLNVLYLGSTVVTDDCLADIAKLNELTDLDLSYTGISDRGLGHLAKLERLSHLNVGHTKLTDHGLKQISAIKNLKSLHLWSTQVTSAGLQDIPKLKELSILSLSGANVTDAGLKEVAKCANLTELNVTDSKVTDRALRAIANLDKLASLDLSNCKVTCAGSVGKNGFRSLSKLNLYSTGVTDAGLGELFKLTKLSSLNLEKTKITDAGLKGIDKLTNLRTLNTSGTKVTDEGLKEIARLTHLKELSIRDVDVTDVGVREIIKLKELTSLDLNISRISETGLRAFGKLTKLEYLGLWGSKVGDEVYRELQSALPNCYISRPD